MKTNVDIHIDMLLLINPIKFVLNKKYRQSKYLENGKMVSWASLMFWCFCFLCVIFFGLLFFTR